MGEARQNAGGLRLERAEPARQQPGQSQGAHKGLGPACLKDPEKPPHQTQEARSGEEPAQDQDKEYKPLENMNLMALSAPQNNNQPR
jgi:hypothetical protein